MMLTDEQRMIRDTVREFVEAEIAPDLPEADRKPMTRDEAVDYMQTMAEIDVGPYAEEGFESDDPRTGSIVTEEISRVWPSLQVTMGMSSIPASVVDIVSEQTREAYEAERANDELVGCFAITEPAGGSDTKVPDTTAVRDGDEYVLDGEKTWVSNAPIADVALVVAWDAEREQRSFFVVDQKTSGFETRSLDKLGWKGSPTGQMFFDDCRIPARNELTNAVVAAAEEDDGDDGGGFLAGSDDPLNTMFATMRNGMASISVGIMQAALDAAVEYATERETFEKPIAQHQLVQELLYDVKAKLETSRHLTYHVDDLIAAGHEDARMMSSLAKGYACEASVEATSKALQVYGGNGLSTDYPLERYFRDARTMTIPDGTTEIQKLVVGYELTGMQAYE
ncbi:MAG: acyl-CoA dehydrogenase family protein [Haloarculaceae archaeon]